MVKGKVIPEWANHKTCYMCKGRGHSVHWCPKYTAIKRITPLTEAERNPKKKPPPNYICRVHTPPIIGKHWASVCPEFEYVRNPERSVPMEVVEMGSGSGTGVQVLQMCYLVFKVLFLMGIHQ